MGFVPDASSAPESSPPIGPAGGHFVPDSPGTQATLGAIAKGVSKQGQADLLIGAGSFKPHAPAPPKLDRLPFTHQAILSMMDNKEEKRAFLEQQYGKGSVTEDSKGLIVKGKDGKSYRGSSSFLASLVGDAPETVLGIAGAAQGATAGSIAGPAGTFVGGVGGAMAGAAGGKTLKEGAKAAAGLYRKTPGEYARTIAGAAEGGAEGEIGGKVVGGAFGAITRRPFPRMISGATQETERMTDKVLKGGARPPAQSTMPDARKLQRIAIIADKLSGPSKPIDRVNRGYLMDQADKILSRAGLRGGAKSSALNSMNQPQAALNTQQTGQMIQQAALTTLHSIQGSKTVGGRKIEAYLKTLAANSRSPEDAYNWLVHGGQTDRMDQFFRVMGKNSQVTQAVQQQALRHAFAGAMESAGENEGVKGLSRWMNQFTEKQQKLLFPGGLHNDLKTLDNEMHFLYPKIKDPSMAGITTGAMMQKKFYERWYHQATGAVFRAFLQNPAVIRRLAIGFKGDSVQRAAARNGLRELMYFGAIEASEPDLDKDQRK